MQGLHHHMPCIVENLQRLGHIVRQLAGYHHGLEPQMNVFFGMDIGKSFRRQCGYGPGRSNRGRMDQGVPEPGRMYRGTGSGTPPSRFKNQVRNSCPEVHCPQVHVVSAMAAYLMPAPRRRHSVHRGMLPISANRPAAAAFPRCCRGACNAV